MPGNVGGHVLATDRFHFGRPSRDHFKLLSGGIFLRLVQTNANTFKCLSEPRQ